MTLDSARVSHPSTNDQNVSTPAPVKTRPRSREAKTLSYLKRLHSLQASSHDVARYLDLPSPWGPAQAVASLEKLIREKKVKKVKSGGETRYLAR